MEKMMLERKLNIQTILIPLDFSDCSMIALEHGAYMASLFKAEVVLLNVIRPNWSAYSISDTVMSIDSRIPLDILVDQKEKVFRKLEGIAEEIRDEYTVRVRTECEIGMVCAEIMTAAENNDVDLIVMGTHGQSGFHEGFIGSNAYTMVNLAKCPVFTIQRHTTEQGFKDIVIPIDHTLYTGQKVHHAIQFAQRYGSRVHILGLSHSAGSNEINALQKKIHRLEILAEKHGVLFDTRFKTGFNYAKLTMDFATEIGADLIIIMNECEEGLTSLFIGPFARQIVNHSNIPVLSIRPELQGEPLKHTLVGVSDMEGG